MITPDSQYANANAKCKVPIGEPNYPVAAIASGKKVIVGLQERFKVSDHDFTKVSVIPNAVLIHDIPDVENGESHGNGADEIFDGIEEGKSKSQGWYTDYYGFKNMVLEGSTSRRCIAELKNILLEHFGGKVPPRLYVITGWW